MFEKRIYSDPRVPGVEIHCDKVSKTSEDRKFPVFENGEMIDDDFEIPKDANIPDFIQGFFAGCAYMGGALRNAKLKPKKV